MYKIRKRNIKLSLFIDAMIVYVETLRESTTTKKLLGLISNHSKVAGYKVNIQKSIVFLYTKNEQIEFEVKNNTTGNTANIL